MKSWFIEAISRLTARTSKADQFNPTGPNKSQEPQNYLKTEIFGKLTPETMGTMYKVLKCILRKFRTEEDIILVEIFATFSVFVANTQKIQNQSIQ